MKAQRNRILKEVCPRRRQQVWLSLLLFVSMFAACTSNAPTSNAPVNTSSAANANGATNAPSASQTNAARGGQQSPLAGIVRASAESVELRAGETADAEVRLSIAEGYHVNANPATEKFLIPTSLEVKPDAGITAGKITYPKALVKKFPFAEVPVAVYEGEARIALTMSAPRDAAPGQHTLAARLRVQPCDDEKCYPPTTIETSIPVTIR
ncbi:MAG TPA: protein-disulfide reductase DsbD domain-containing protein [Pyrinomonadaceae bacterium]|nr:protein-disulfide reductase DsbD domain-containing protein [Pyrinomonadaceae bacterium]